MNFCFAIKRECGKHSNTTTTTSTTERLHVKTIGYFYSYLPVKQEKATNNSNSDNPHFKNRLGDLNVD